MDYEEATTAFEYGKGTDYVIACHGYTGNPYEMKELGRYLADNGFHVIGPKLVGHGKTKEEFANTKWQDWYSEIQKTIQYIKHQKATNLFMTGLSMGGSFTLYSAAQYSNGIKAIAPICAPVFIKNKLLLLKPIIQRLPITYFPSPKKVYTINKNVWKDEIILENIMRYDKFVIPTVVSLLDFLKQLKNEHLSTITQPILIVHARKDSFVHPSNAPFIFDKIASEEKHLLWLKNSDHMATVDNDKEELFRKITEFFLRHRN